MCRWLLVFLLVLSTASPSGAQKAPLADATLEELLRDIGRERFLSATRRYDSVSKPLGFVAPGYVVERLAKSGARFPEVAAAFGKEYGLPASAAAALARAHIRQFHRGLGFHQVDLDPLIEDLAIAIRASKGSLVPVVSAMRLSEYPASAAQRQQIVRMLEPLADSLPEMSKSIARAAPVTGHVEIWLLALEHDPSLLRDFVLADPGKGHPALYPSYGTALKTLKLSSDERAAVLNASLDVLLSTGLAFDAVAFFKALPETDRAALLERSQRPRDSDSTRQSAGRAPDLALPLAAAFFLTGDGATAEAIFRRLDASSAGHGFWLLDAALHPERDPFESLARSTYREPLWGQIALWLASTYPVFELEALWGLTQPPHYPNPDDVNHPPRRATRAMEPIDRKVAELQARWQAQLESLLEPHTDARSDHASKAVARLLASPVLEACTPTEKMAGPAWTAFRPAAPQGFSLERAARLDDQAVALLRASNSSEYWVMRSTDAGQSWTAPAYLGLRADNPYFVGDDGSLRLDNGLIELSVKVRRFTYDGMPSVKPAGTETAVRLSCDLSVIERDSDGDGLSDLEEHWLLTDPFHADTDRDGLTDDVDPIPHVPFEGARSMEGLAMLEALTYSSRDLGRVRPQVGPPQGPARLAGRRPTDFVVGRRASFHGLSPADRLIVLSPGEVRLARARKGDRHAFRRHLVAASHSGTQVFIDRRASHGGHTYLLKKKRDGWHYILLREWMV